jgi:putative tricarboxylic transport membrane protein
MTGQVPGAGARDRAARIALSVFLVLLSAFYLWQSTLVSDPPRNVAVGPRTFPFLISGIMLIAALYVLWGDIKSVGRAALVEEEEGPQSISDWPAVALTVASIFGLLIALPYLGFVLSLTFFIGGLATFFSRAHWLRNFLVGAIFSVSFYLLFTQALLLPLPNGVLANLF